LGKMEVEGEEEVALEEEERRRWRCWR